MLTKEKRGWTKSTPLVSEIDVKGVALKTHQRPCLWKPQAFEKACAKLFGEPPPPSRGIVRRAAAPKSRNRSTSLARGELGKFVDADEVATVAEQAMLFGSTA